MNPRNGARRFLGAALMLWGVIPLALGCGDAASVSQVSPTIIPASRQAAEVKMPKELWVTSQGENVIFIRNFEDLSAVDQITLPSGAGPHIVAFHTPDFAYVGGMTDGNVHVIDATPATWCRASTSLRHSRTRSRFRPTARPLGLHH